MANINDNAQSSATQCNMIADWLTNGNTLTSLDALKMFGCMRLASRICDLRDRGYDIETKRIKLSTNKYVTQYSLKKDGNENL